MNNTSVVPDEGKLVLKRRTVLCPCPVVFGGGWGGGMGGRLQFPCTLLLKSFLPAASLCFSSHL